MTTDNRLPDLNPALLKELHMMLPSKGRGWEKVTLEELTETLKLLPDGPLFNILVHRLNDIAALEENPQKAVHWRLGEFFAQAAERSPGKVLIFTKAEVETLKSYAHKNARTQPVPISRRSALKNLVGLSLMGGSAVVGIPQALNSIAAKELGAELDIELRTLPKDSPKRTSLLEQRIEAGNAEYWSDMRVLGSIGAGIGGHLLRRASETGTKINPRLVEALHAVNEHITYEMGRATDKSAARRA